jgi:hypothetical protein
VQTAGGRRIHTQVIGFRNGRVLSMPLEEIDGLQLGDPVAARSEDSRVEVGPGLLGRVIDGFGKPMDNGPAIEARETRNDVRGGRSQGEGNHVLNNLRRGIHQCHINLVVGELIPDNRAVRRDPLRSGIVNGVLEQRLADSIHDRLPADGQLSELRSAEVSRPIGRRGYRRQTRADVLIFAELLEVEK